jgi:hypothetical protein
MVLVLIFFLRMFLLCFTLTIYSGLEIWRIENFRPAIVPKSSHGKFFMGDSYVILKVSEYILFNSFLLQRPEAIFVVAGP